jgi:hypothetical protein
VGGSVDTGKRDCAVVFEHHELDRVCMAYSTAVCCAAACGSNQMYALNCQALINPPRKQRCSSSARTSIPCQQACPHCTHPAAGRLCLLPQQPAPRGPVADLQGGLHHAQVDEVQGAGEDHLALPRPQPVASPWAHCLYREGEGCGDRDAGATYLVFTQKCVPR